MDRSHWLLVILCFMFWTLAGFFYHVHDNYESYLMGREKERSTITLSYPPVGMVDMDNKNYCVDGGLNVHEVKYVGGKFISKKVHLTKNGEAPQ